MVVWSGLRLAAAGLALGIALALLLSRTLSRFSSRRREPIY